MELSDGGGLQLWIEPKGGKLWRLAYRFDGKQKKLAIGPYPAIDLRAARPRREEAKDLLRDGKDPGAEKRREKLTGKANRENTFAVIAEEPEAIKKAGGKAQTTIDKFNWHIGLAKPDLGKRPIAEISAAEVLASYARSKGADCWRQRDACAPSSDRCSAMASRHGGQRMIRRLRYAGPTLRRW